MTTNDSHTKNAVQPHLIVARLEANMRDIQTLVRRSPMSDTLDARWVERLLNNSQRDIQTLAKAIQQAQLWSVEVDK